MTATRASDCVGRGAFTQGFTRSDDRASVHLTYIGNCCVARKSSRQRETRMILANCSIVVARVRSCDARVRLRRLQIERIKRYSTHATESC